MRLFALIILNLCIAVPVLAQQKLVAGSVAPDFSAQTLNGKQFNLSEMHGKVVVLTFWSTRCEICHTEIPKLNQVAQRYKDKDVVFVAATMESEQKIAPYLSKNPFVFDVLPNSFGLVLKYADLDRSGNINIGFPAYYIINKKGAIELRSDGWDKTGNVDSQIARLLAAN